MGSTSRRSPRTEQQLCPVSADRAATADAVTRRTPVLKHHGFANDRLLDINLHILRP
jgi:hypothetical protein